MPIYITTKDEGREEQAFADVMALELLKTFIANQYPTPDPVKQVAAAYLYATLFAKRRTEVIIANRLKDE